MVLNFLELVGKTDLVVNNLMKGAQWLFSRKDVTIILSNVQTSHQEWNTRR